MKRINASEHIGYKGYLVLEADDVLVNGEVGIDTKAGTLVVCCGNCGGYRHVSLEAIKDGNHGK